MEFAKEEKVVFVAVCPICGKKTEVGRNKIELMFVLCSCGYKVAVQRRLVAYQYSFLGLVPRPY